MIYFSFKNWKQWAKELDARLEFIEKIYKDAYKLNNDLLEHGLIWCPSKKRIRAMNEMTFGEVCRAVEYHRKRKESKKRKAS